MPRERHTLSPRVAMRLARVEGTGQIQAGQIKIALAGAGGNGSHMLSKLARLDHALRLRGLCTLDVDVYDPDTVATWNVGRQQFYLAEIGLNKAFALVNRANLSHGLYWHASPAPYLDQDAGADSVMGIATRRAYDVLITCVDSGAARRRIYDALRECAAPPYYWLDLGNERAAGQVILGEPQSLFPVTGPRLPVIVEKYPEFYDGTLPESDAPACSAAEAMERQALYVNDQAAILAAQILETLLVKGEIDYAGAFYDLDAGRINRVPIDTIPAHMNIETASDVFFDDALLTASV